MSRSIFVLILCMCFLMASAQDFDDWEECFEMLAATDDESVENWERLHEDLSGIPLHSIDINSCTRADLEQLGFLSNTQIDDIYDYARRYRPLRSLGELLLIRSIDGLRRRLLGYFLYIGEAKKKEPLNVKEILKRGSHEINSFVNVPFYTPEDNDKYLGYKYKHWLRYQFRYKSMIKAGLVASQDAGEPFFSGENKLGYDHYSYYFQMKDIGRLTNVVAGCFRASFGMGLIVNTNISYGKTSLANYTSVTGNAFRPHSSRMSGLSYFRGVGATVRLFRPLFFSAFISWRDVDATINVDGTARTLVTNGYHRTPAEMKKKNNTGITTGGAHVDVDVKAFHFGATAVMSHFSRDLVPNTNQLVNRHRLKGNDFVNASIDYGYRSHRLSFNGETALSKGAIATVNRLIVKPWSPLSLMVLYRFYSFKYASLYASSFSDGSRVQNESGVFVSADYLPNRKWHLNLYADVAYHPWATTAASQSSTNIDTRFEAEFIPSEKLTIYGRYRLTIRQQDDADNHLRRCYVHRGRLAASARLNRLWQVGANVDACMSAFEQNDWGYTAGLTARFSWHWLSLNAIARYYYTTGYSARLYVIEGALPYTMNSQMLYGNGFRTTLFAKAVIGRHLSLASQFVLSSRSSASVSLRVKL